MRIGMLADAYVSHVSGVTNHVALNKKAMEKAGHEVFVFTFGDVEQGEEDPTIIVTPGLPVIDTGFYVNVTYSKHARELVSTMDVLHVHHPFISGTLALRYGKSDGIPVVFTNHTRYDLYYQAYLPKLPESLGENFLQTYMPNFCERCDMVIAPSPGMCKVLREFGVEGPIEIVPNGVDLHPIRNTEKVIPRERFGFTNEDVVMIFVGRVAPEKNISFLLQSFSGIAQAYDQPRLVIIGDGPLREELQHQTQKAGLQNKVHFTGLVPYDQIPAYLKMADVYVTASVTEVHPLTVIEAMAAGLPILGIHSPGVGDTVVDNYNGLLATHDMAAFTAKLARLTSEPALRRQLGEQANISAEAYAIEHTSKMLLEKYEEVIAKSKKQARGIRALFRRVRSWIKQ